MIKEDKIISRKGAESAKNDSLSNVADQTVDRSNANGVTQIDPAESELLGGADAPAHNADVDATLRGRPRPLSLSMSLGKPDHE